MAAAMSDTVTLELHGFLARSLAELGTPRGSRIFIVVPLAPTAGALLERLLALDSRYRLLYEPGARLPEHVEVVLNDRVLDLQGGLNARLKAGDVLTFVPAHAGG
jgi:molybdopterin converting factor small subunit